MKPLTGWPRGKSVLKPVTWPSGRVEHWRVMVRYFAGVELAVPEIRAVEDSLELFYRCDQEWKDWQFRNGEPNAGLRQEVVQTIQWMAGTPQFLEHSGLQIVPQTDEQLGELEVYLETHRIWRAEPIAYYFPITPATPYKPNHDLLDPWNEQNTGSDPKRA